MPRNDRQSRKRSRGNNSEDGQRKKQADDQDDSMEVDAASVSSLAEGTERPTGDIVAGEEVRFERWLDEGTGNENGTIDHELLLLMFPDEETREVSIGDNLLVKVDNQPSSSIYSNGDDNIDYYGSSTKQRPSTSIVRVERLWEINGDDAKEEDEDEEDEVSSNIRIQLRFFQMGKDVHALPKLVGPGDFGDTLTDRDVVLTNRTDSYDGVSSIAGTCQIIYRRPHADSELPELPQDTFVCRYTLDMDGKKHYVSPFEGSNDSWDLVIHQGDHQGVSSPAKSRRKTSTSRTVQSGDSDSRPPSPTSTEEGRNQNGEDVSSDQDNASSSNSSANSNSDSSSQSSHDDDDDGDDVNDDMIRRAAAPEAEGTTEQRDIRVGPEHQAIVPPFRPNQVSVTRTPKLVWQPSNISTSEFDRYCEKASVVLTQYLKDNDLSSQDPYSPLPAEKMEKQAVESHGGKSPTLSTMSTSSSLSSTTNSLLRECDTDALLANLHDSKYDVDAAAETIARHPRNFLSCWTVEEKELFNSGFRRYSGSLRMIAKGIAPTKDFQDVIDYQYRFKIPDQFRRFQEKKREQAVRMMECIETRRYASSYVPMEKSSSQEKDTSKRSKSGDWSKMGTNDLIGNVEERRISAKQFLLDVETKLGKDKLAEVADAIKQLHQKSVAELRTVLLGEILKGHADLQQRCLDFLPKRLRF